MEQLTLTGEILRDPWEDEELLREMYHGNGLSLREIGNRLGCDHTTIHRRMVEFGIERRKGSGAPGKLPYAPYRTREHGMAYEYWQTKHTQFPVHRLLAVAIYGFDEVGGKIVHHKTPIPWLNVPDNIGLFESHEEHQSYHARMGRAKRNDAHQTSLIATTE